MEPERGRLPRYPRVYPVREDTLLLLRAARVARGERVLDLGCGSGLVSLSASCRGARVVASDINPHALRALRVASRSRRAPVDLVRTDLFAGMRAFDVVLCNPPYLPTRPAERDPDPWENAALDGGPDGLRFVRRFLRELPSHLVPGGRAYLLVASVAPTGGKVGDALHRLRGLRVARVAGRRSLPGEELAVLELRASAAGAAEGSDAGASVGTDGRSRPRRVPPASRRRRPPGRR